MKNNISGDKPTITSHAFRVRRAKEYIKNMGESIDIFDREALVEFYLLEDVHAIIGYYLGIQRQSEMPTAETAADTEKYEALEELYNCAMQLAQQQISSGNYGVVSGAIPEYALMSVAKCLDLCELRKLGEKVLKNIYEDFLDELPNEESKECEEFTQHIETVIQRAKTAIPD